MGHIRILATYPLDDAIHQRTKHLARTWHVFQAEVIRRSVRMAEEQTRNICAPANVVARYAKTPLPRSQEATRQAIESLRSLRHADDEHRATKTM